MEEFRANTGLINKQLADRSHAFTSFDPETRARQEIDGFGAEVQAVYEEVSRYAHTDAQKAFLAEEMQRFQAGYAAKYNDKLAAHGRCISTFITGASGFPAGRAQKANNSYENRVNDMLEFKERATAAMIRELKKMATEEAGGELEILKMRLASAEKTHEAMKTCNAIIRKNLPLEDAVKAIIEQCGFSEATARKVLFPDFCGRVGFTYHLQNNNANIKRMKERLAELQQKEATPTSDIKFTGGRIVDNAEADRVQIIHDEKPAQTVIDKLKSEGWRWSPAGRCWQRKRTPMAMQSAKRITGAV